MMTLFNQYKQAGSISEALLVGRNLFNQNPENSTVFDGYYGFLCQLAESLPSLDDKITFAQQADVALAFFTENTAISEEVVSAIGVYQSRINEVMQSIADAEQTKGNVIRQEKETVNDECLKKLYQIKSRLQSTLDQTQFDAILGELADIDAAMDKDYLNDEQSSVYDELTQAYTDLISSTMQKLEYQKNIKYNRDAVDAFEKAFKKFRADETHYKNQTQLFALVSKSLFAYDASRLFNETLIYYNHVYSYIFGKLDDDGKLALTRYSIECERKARA